MTDKEKNIDYVMKINMWLVDTYREDLLNRLGISIADSDEEAEKLINLSHIFNKIYEEENKKYPLPWYQYGFKRKS